MPWPRLPIATVLALAISGLVGIAVAVVLAVLFVGGREGTLSLVRDKGELIVSGIETRLREQLEPVAIQLAFVAELLARPDGPTDDMVRLADLLTGALAATPQIARVGFVDTKFRRLIVDRGRDEVETRIEDQSDNESIRDSVVEMGAMAGGQWSDVLFSRAVGRTTVIRRHSVWRNNRFVGYLVAFVSMRQVSAFLASESASGGVANGFVLHDRVHVLAHSQLSRPFAGLSPERPMPEIGEIDDPVLAQFHGPAVALPMLGRSSGVRVVEVEGRRYVFFTRIIYGYADKPWTIGTYVEAQDAIGPLRQLAIAGAFGLGILAVAVVAGIVLGRLLARPIRRLAAAAGEARNLEFGRVPDLPRSRIVEIDAQARAFNDMLGGLRWFEAYVPRALVRRLVRRGPNRAFPSIEREVTVLFSDIAGFTAAAERMTAVQTADLLNRHFAIVARAIESTEGTLDKFIGDSVMAFWGAPTRQRDHAVRAVRAALAAAAAIAEDNRSRCRAGLDPIRVRIGLHSGPAVIGNIGAPGRINFTLVGDTVNAAQRIEELGRDVAEPGEEVAVLASGATAAALPPDIAREHIGDFTLRGRAGMIPIYRLL